MITKIASILIVLFLASFVCLYANENENIVDLFSSENTAWTNAMTVRSSKYGVSCATPQNPGEMWYEGTIGKEEDYTWFSKPVPVSGSNQLIVRYNAIPGTFFTVDLYWDTMPGEQLRPCSYALGDGTWHDLVVPVRGKAVTIGFSISSRGDEKTGGLKKVSIRQLIGTTGSVVPKIDTAGLVEPLIIPEPKQVKNLGSIITLVENGKSSFIIRRNTSDKKFKDTIVAEIAEEIGKPVSSTALAKTVIELCLGRESSIAIPNKKEGYSISFLKTDGKNYIILAGKDKAGLYWAWQTFRQLISRKEVKVTATACNIKDWPDYPSRGYVCYGIASLKESLRWKANFIPTPAWSIANGWRKPSDEFIKTIGEMSSYAAARGADIAEWIQPVQQTASITISDDKEIQLLMDAYDISLSKGSRGIIVGIDDGGRNAESFTDADKKAYNDDQLLSHAWLAKKMTDKIHSEYPDAKVSIITKDYESPHGIRGYYDRIGVSKKLLILWTGEQCVTFDYPRNVIDKYEEGIGGRDYMVFDNTPSQTHGMYRGLTIFEKYGEGYGGLCKSGRCKGFHEMAGFGSPTPDVLSLSIAEYMWNASRYNAERARQRAIAKVAGNPMAVRPIIQYANEYLKIAYKYPIDKRLSTKLREDFIIEKGKAPVVGTNLLEDKELSRYSIDDTEYERLKPIFASTQTLVKEIESTSRNPLLAAEIKMFQRNMIEVIDYLHGTQKISKVNSTGTFVFNINDVPGGTHYTDWGNGKIGCAIYGQQTPNNMLEAVFEMDTIPAGDVTLAVEGQDCDKNQADMQIKVNGQEIFAGKTPFVKNGWVNKEFLISNATFRSGRNVLQIINTSQSSDFIDHWALISGIEFRF